MKQKKFNDKRRNISNTRNKRTASSAAYKRIKRATKDHQKSNYDNQTDNKDNNRNIDMSMGLGEEKKLKGKTGSKGRETLVIIRSNHNTIITTTYIINTSTRGI